MRQELDECTVVVLEPTRCLMAESTDSDTAMTVLALLSEDPSSWDEAASVWPRYCSPAVCEFASGVPFAEADRESAIAALSGAHAWLVIDFDSGCIFTGGKFQEVGRDAAFAMVVDENGKQHCPMSVHLPPWWELHENADVSEICQSRQSPFKRPHVNRDVLYGEAFLADIAGRILKAVNSPAWRQSSACHEEPERYPFTIAVHRDWLMTPREDLDGRMPRELLHGAIEWINRVTWGQRLRFEDGGLMVAAPDDWDRFATAPMGSQEMCIYFDLCRELINAGWFWCEGDDGIHSEHASESAVSWLIAFLKDVKEDWLNSSFEGGSTPGFIIECDRRRVPRGAGVAIQGIHGVESERHIADCDCPICEMMADGMFGIGFTSIDGHHLELDDEFAFSMHETREAWEAQQREYEEFSAEMDRKQAERKQTEACDPFGTAWSGVHHDGTIPGDRGGYLKMAFMIGEIVSDLQRLEAEQEEIKTLNDGFASYRRSDGSFSSGEHLIEILQIISERYPELISKAADMQSRIDEATRPVACDDSDLGYPF
jgi:hypothetical protein